MWFVRLPEDMWYDRITFVYLRGRHPTLSQRRAFETWNFTLPHANAAELLGGQGQDRWAVEDQTSQRHQKILTFEIAKGSVQRQMNHKILWVYGVRLPEYVWIPCALVSTYLCLSGIPPRNSWNYIMSSKVPVTQKDGEVTCPLPTWPINPKRPFSLFLPGNCWCLAPSGGSICSTPT